MVAGSYIAYVIKMDYGLKLVLEAVQPKKINKLHQLRKVAITSYLLGHVFLGW